MKTWSYGVNSIYKKVSIYLEEASWWVFVVDRVVEFLCDFMPSVPLPKIEMRLKDKEEIEFNRGSEWTTLRDWYGDLRQVFHCFVHRLSPEDVRRDGRGIMRITSIKLDSFSKFFSGF